MMLPFTGQRDEILDRIKTLSTRRDEKNWYLLNCTKDTRLDMWWQNPRTRHPDCYKMGRALCSWTRPREGWKFTTEEAKWDGFDSVEDYVTRLGEMYDMDRVEVLDWVWTQIKWDIWLDGPHKPRKVA